MRLRVVVVPAAIAAALSVGTGLAIGGSRSTRPEPAASRTAIADDGHSAADDGHPTEAEGLDAANFDAALAFRFGDPPTAYTGALAARTRMAKHKPVPGGRGHWQPAAAGPLVANSPKYPDSQAGGYGLLSGRITSFAYDPTRRHLFASAAQGGIWESYDLGTSWHSIAQGLPTQVVGAIGYTAAGGNRGTLVASTGDNALGAYTYSGLGAYWSTNEGQTWHRAAGLPYGALSFKIAVDPTNPSVIYDATGLGLYRSGDAGRSYQNVGLPTGRCAGNSLLVGCFFANVVTDVVVQGPDHYGHSGGAVLAAVGWRAGPAPALDGSPQSPANGLYSSATGLPGSFQRLAATGFTPAPQIGRVALGVASGANQNHGYVYAAVQDAVLFNTGKLLGLDIPSLPDPLGLGIDPTKTDTDLNGVYVSADFGRTWKLMAAGLEFELPANGSTLTGDPAYELLGNYGPGIQAWFNEWIEPDPSRQVRGVPTRIIAGLEELWQSGSTTRAADGLESFHALTPYNGNKTPDCIIQLLDQVLCQHLPRYVVSTIHPDQHAGMFIPSADGGVTLMAGSDGGVYRQSVARGQELTTAGFGVGAQSGLQTLEPYGVSISGDGTIYAGLQDNGNIKIDPGGQQFETLGGDGIFTAVNPTNSKVAYDTLPNGIVFVTTNGGTSWRDATPGFETDPSFYTPLAMDPTNAAHLVTGGREIFESLSGSNTAKSSNGLTVDAKTDWRQVFDLGTRQHPGDPAAAGGGPDDSVNQVSAITDLGPDAYVAYCGDCDPVKDNALFGDGIATNVLGKLPPKPGTPNGWHIAAAGGLPHRMITSVAIDPADPRHIFVTLGGSTLRTYVAPGQLGNDGVSTQAGAVFESLDAGNTFTDVTGNLPHIGVSWVAFHHRQLVVADTVGVFATTGRVSTTRITPLRYGPLGTGLPTAPVFSLALSPSDPNLLVAGTYGRSVWTYRFSKR
jgi:hypothetical protein